MTEKGAAISKQSKEIISEILEDYDFDYVEYITPGKELGERLNVSEKIVLLENHGLICSGNSFEETFNMSLKVNQLCKEWLIRNSKTFKTFRDTVGASGSQGQITAFLKGISGFAEDAARKLAVGVAAFGNFLLNKRWTFKEKVWS
mgnify:CR=1 FL=1